MNLQTLAQAVQLASKTSAWNAQRAFGISTRTVLLEMRRQGLPVRARGTYSTDEHARVLPLLVA